jgi:hypothetical protein
MIEYTHINYRDHLGIELTPEEMASISSISATMFLREAAETRAMQRAAYREKIKLAWSSYLEDETPVNHLGVQLDPKEKVNVKDLNQLFKLVDK